MKKSYSTPNVMFQPLDIANTFSAGDCAFITSQKEGETLTQPAKPGPGLIADGWDASMTVFAGSACEYEPDGGQICYATSTYAVFNS